MIKSTHDLSITRGLIICQLQIYFIFSLKVDWSVGGKNSWLLVHLEKSRENFSSLICETRE